MPLRISLTSSCIRTPNLESRLKRLSYQLSSSGMSTNKANEIIDMVAPFLEERWESHLQFLNFAENEAFLVCVKRALSVTTINSPT